VYNSAEEERPSNSDRLPQDKELAMANQDYKFAGGKPDAPPADATRRSELSEAPPARSVAGRGRVSNYSVSFANQTGALPKKGDQSISMDDRHEELTTSCPSEVFIG
jgi:hypothetical protein